MSSLATTPLERLGWVRLGSSQQTLLKVLAIALMLLDHANSVLWGSQPWAYTLGRISYPLFTFLIAYNVAVRGVKPQRYALPLLLFGIVSQGPAMLALGRDPFPLNIFFTLLVGVTYLPLRRWYASTLPAGRVAEAASWLLTTLLFLLLSLPLEYGPAGVFLIALMVVFLERPSLAAGVGVLILLLLINRLTWSSLAAWLVVPLVAWVRTLELPTLPRLKWLFYGFYPLHLLGLWLLKTGVG